MALFRRDRSKGHGAGPPHPRLGSDLLRSGWTPAGPAPFDGILDSGIHDVTRAMFGDPRTTTAVREVTLRVGDTEFDEAYRKELGGRAVTVANAWTTIEPQIQKPQIAFGSDHEKGVGVCAVELGSVLPVHRIESRRYPAVSRTRVTPTGDPAFDERFLVSVLVDGAPALLTPEVRARLSVRDDWTFVAERYLFGCIVRGSFASGADVAEVAQQVLDIVSAFPVSMAGAVDHSADDIVERATHLSSLDEAMAFLQGLSDEERQRLKASPTPLSALADARTPEEAMATFSTLDQDKKLELMALVMRVKNHPA